MFDYLTEEEVLSLELVAPIPAELAPPIEETESVYVDTPWLIGWGLLFVGAFTTIGFLLYA